MLSLAASEAEVLFRQMTLSEAMLVILWFPPQKMKISEGGYSI